MRLRITIVTLIALLLGACGGTSDEPGSAGLEPPAGDEPVEAAVDEPADQPDDQREDASGDEPAAEASPETEPPATETDLDVPPCPAPPVVPDLAPADVSALPFPAEGAGLPPGNYGSAVLGVSIAIDVPDAFEDVGVFGESIGLFGPFDPVAGAGAVFAITRPEGFVPIDRTEEQVALGEPRRIVDLSTWLDETGVDVIADGPTTVADRPARQVRFSVSDDLVNSTSVDGTLFGDMPLTPDLRAQPGDYEHFVVEIELEVGASLILYGAGPGDDLPVTMQAMVDSLAIGGVGERSAVVYADTPWDSGNIFRPQLVGACLVPALAFDGVTFELSQPALIMGGGDELWVFEASGRHVGFREPYVNLVRPDTTATGGNFGQPSPGDPVVTVDDALAEFEEEGFELTPLGEVGTLLGAPALGFDFTVETDDPWLWFPRSHVASTGLGFASEEGRWEGTIWMAELDDGVLIVTAGGEIDTGDVDLVRTLFDEMVTTLAASG